MLPPPVRERHCSSPGRPSCGPPRGGRAWLDFFFFSSGRRKGKRERQWKEGRLAVDFFSFTFPESLSKSFSDASKEGMSPSPSLLRSSRTLPPAASPPRRATLVPLQRPHLLSQPVRAFKEGEKKKSSGDGAARRRGRNPRSHESARCERNVVTQPSLPARLRLSPWFRPPLVERKETREGQTARNDADDALDAALFETKKPKKSHLHLSFSFFFFAGERPGAPQSSTPPACRRLPQQHRPDPLLDPRRRQRPHPGIRGRPGPRPPGEQSVGRKKEKEERERKKKREREREREKERKPQKSRPPQKTQKKKNSSPPLPQGFHDRDYKLRRASLAEIARTHVPGTPPPFVAYSSDETAVWSEVFAAASRLYPLAACPEFLRALPALGFTESAIPQLRDVSETLERKTGWQVRPVAGLMHPRDFLAGLAFKTFHSTQYTRHASRPAYTPVSLIFLSL